MQNKQINMSKQGQYSIRRSFTQLLDLMNLYPFVALGIILFLGILLSIVSIANHPPSLKSGETDSWWMIALNLIHGHGYSLCLTQYFPFCGPTNQMTAMREPVPVFLFAAVAWLGKDSLWLAAVLEAVIYLSIVVAVYFLTREWTDTRSAVIASFLWATYLPALELLPQVSGDLFAALCTTLGIFFTLRARKTQDNLDWIIAGVGLGLAIISRSATLAIALLVIGGQTLDGLRKRLQPKNIIRPILLLSGLVILIMAPWLIRNKIALGRTIIGSSLTGYNLYRHNYMIGMPHHFRYVGPQEGYQAVKNLISHRTDLHGDENEGQMDLVYRGEALLIIKSHPMQYVLLSAYRIFPLWFDWEISEAYGRSTNRYEYLIMLLQLFLLTLALVGMWKNAAQTWPLWGSILAISFAYMAVDARMLYVMPVMPLVISLSAVGGKNLLDYWLRK